MRIPLIVLVTFVITLGLGGQASGNFSTQSNLHKTPAPNLFSYSDDFEMDTQWQMVEEIVGGNPCYGDGIGSAERSTNQAYQGQYSLLVWANQAQSLQSNHVIAYKPLSTDDQSGRWEYQLHAYIDPGSEGSGQTGPEFSVQNTRYASPGVNTTAIAGIQYVATPYYQFGTWNVWHEGAWQYFMTHPIQVGEWYTLTLDMDYVNDRYINFTLEGNGENFVVNLSEFRIAEEIRGFGEAFIITLEDENLWNNCGTAGVFDYQVYYDDIRISQEYYRQYLPISIK
jgi:hypothetical protein